MVANIVSYACSMLHLVIVLVFYQLQLHHAKMAKAQLVDCQTLDQWILYKTFYKCLGYTLNFNMFPNI